MEEGIIGGEKDCGSTALPAYKPLERLGKKSRAKLKHHFVPCSCSGNRSSCCTTAVVVQSKPTTLLLALQTLSTSKRAERPPLDEASERTTPTSSHTAEHTKIAAHRSFKMPLKTRALGTLLNTINRGLACIPLNSSGMAGDETRSAVG